MNCLEFRHQCRIDPHSTAADFVQHKQTCARCAAVAAAALDFEYRLEAAFRLPVPPQSAERLHLARALQESRRRRLYASAASVLLVIGGAWMGATQLWPQPVERLVVNHVEAELDHLSENRQLSNADLNRILAGIGVEVRGELGPINYAGLCKMRRKLGAHLVLAGTRGPVTVLLMPGESVTSRRVLRDGQFHGSVLPLVGGSVAILGVGGEDIKVWERRIQIALSGRLS